MVFFTKPLYNQDFYTLAELRDSSMYQIAFMIQMLKVQQKNEIPAEVTAEQMTSW